MKTLILLSFLLHSLIAYEVGSKVDEKLVSLLKIDDNRTYIIDFFASWCHSCEKEIPELNRLNRSLDRSRYELIGVSIDKDIQKAKAFERSLHVSFRVLNDTTHEIVSAFKPLGMPSLYIVKEKKVLHVIIGAVDNINEVIVSQLGVHND
ncbi:MAG: TlpA disulfide reductase family protein [Campylobacterota bacterium]|nr:TlpA disulfide reductase family protein [Campylobacterota bacterium]